MHFLFLKYDVMSISIKKYQEKVDKWIKTYGVRYFNEMTNLALLNEEVGEFSGLVARVYGEQSFKKEIDKDEIKCQLEDEIADVMFVLICLSNQMEIDLESAIEKNFSKKTNRDKERHRLNNKLK